MNRTTVKVALVASLCGLSLAALPAKADPNPDLLLDLGTGGSPIPCGSCGNGSGQTFGWAFEVLETIKVDGIGAWDFGADGIGPDVQAGLWDSSGTYVPSAVTRPEQALIALITYL